MSNIERMLAFIPRLKPWAFPPTYRKKRNNSIDPRYYSYVLTCDHVCGTESELEAEIFNFGDHGILSSTKHTATILERSLVKDISVLEIISTNKLDIVDTDDSDRYYEHKLYEKAYVVGCPLSKTPIITSGNITNLDDVLQNLNVTAPAFFGNSGGGVYSIDGRLLGIVKSIGGINGIAYPDFVVAEPIWSIFQFLQEKKMGFLFNKEETSSKYLEFKLAQSKKIAEDEEEAFKKLLDGK